MPKDIKFNFKANYPLPENQKEFDRRASSAIAKILIETYHPEVIDDIIRVYEEKYKKGEVNHAEEEFNNNREC